MGRSVFIEEIVEKRILKLFGETKWTTGILIGQSTLHRDYIIHLALTPSQESEEVSVGSSKKRVKQSNLDYVFDEDWFIQHCRQVNCMLTGGLRILGIFVFGPSDVRTRLQAKFRQTLYSFNKMTCNEFMLAKWKIEQSSGQIIFQVCSETKKMTCYTIDVSDTKANIQPADLKCQNFVSKWIRLHCPLVDIELIFTLLKKYDGKTCFSNVKSGLMPILCKIAYSLATVNGNVLDDEQLLVAEKQKGRLSETNVTRIVNLYLAETVLEPDIVTYTRRHVSLVGAVDSWAFLHPKATVKEAVDAIKCDVIRSILTRCRLLCEDMDERNYDDNEDLEKWELPKRIFAPICRGNVEVSDYVFKDEDSKDVLNRLFVLLGISAIEDDLVSDELFPDGATCEKLIQDGRMNKNEHVKTKINSNTGSTSYSFFGTSFGVLAVAVAALFKWYLNE